MEHDLFMGFCLIFLTVGLISMNIQQRKDIATKSETIKYRYLVVKDIELCTELIKKGDYIWLSTDVKFIYFDSDIVKGKLSVEDLIKKSYLIRI